MNKGVEQLFARGADPLTASAEFKVGPQKRMGRGLFTRAPHYKCTDNCC